MVFGLCSGFSLGVSAVDDVQLFDARTQDFSWYEAYIHSTTYDNLTSFQKVLDGNNIAFELPALISSDYHAPSVSARSYITDTYNLLNLSDIGYYTDTLLTSYNYSAAAENRTYTVVDRITWKQRVRFAWGDTQSVFINDMSNIYMNCSSAVASDTFFGIDLTLPSYEMPSLRSGQEYIFSVYCSGIPSGTFFGANDGSDLGVSVPFDGNYASFSFTPKKDYSLSDIGLYFHIVGQSNIKLQLQSLTVTAVYDNDDVVDAINNQTGEINKNHDETMGKIDDVTDFDEQEQSDLTGAVDGASDQIKDKLGILSFGDHVLDQFFGIFDAVSGSPGITLPGFSIEVDGVQHVVWTDQVFDLSTIEDKFGPLMTAVHFATSFLVYAALVMYVQKIFGAIMQDWSDK